MNPACLLSEMAKERKVDSDTRANRYTHLTLYALAAAIPHALLLLHSLLDILPYPVGRKGMWYEIRTGSVECVDEIDGNVDVVPGSGKRRAGGGDATRKTGEEGEDGKKVIDARDQIEFEGLGMVEAAEPVLKSRIKVSASLETTT